MSLLFSRRSHFHRIIHIYFFILLFIAAKWLQHNPTHIAAKETNNELQATVFKYPSIYTKPRTDSNDFLLILVSSSPHDKQHRNKRNIIRQTWGNCKNLHIMSSKSKFLPKYITCKLVFFMGRTVNDTSILTEAQQYADILIIDYQDDYKNITTKLLSAFKWASFFSYKYILKTDDDVFVHVPRLILKLLTVVQTRFYAGIIWIGSVNRKPEGRHFVSFDTFAEEWFPPFCKGALYVFSGSLLPELLKSVNKTPVFGVDDAYVGLLMRDIKVIPVPIREFVNIAFNGFLQFISDCVLVNTIGLSDGLTSSQILYIYERMKYLDMHGTWHICFQFSELFLYLIVVTLLLAIFLKRKRIFVRKFDI